MRAPATGAFFARILIAALLAASGIDAQNAPAIVGTWKLNTEKSQLPPLAAGFFEIRQYTMRPDGYLVGLLITSNARGYHYLQFTAKSDGKDYPEYSDDVVADLIASNKPTTRSYSERIVDEYVTEWTDKVNGKVTASGKKIVSNDGHTLTITVDGTSRIRVYDRQ
ncbi:MAG TPA: hypothetical protein VH436_26435 [Vicinamibacterales bacterium]